MEERICSKGGYLVRNFIHLYPCRGTNSCYRWEVIITTVHPSQSPCLLLSKTLVSGLPSSGCIARHPCQHKECLEVCDLRRLKWMCIFLYVKETQRRLYFAWHNPRPSTDPQQPTHHNSFSSTGPPQAAQHNQPTCMSDTLQDVQHSLLPFTEPP